MIGLQAACITLASAGNEIVKGCSTRSSSRPTDSTMCAGIGLDLLRIGADQGVFADQIDDAGNPLRVVMNKLRRLGQKHRLAGSGDAQSLCNVSLCLFARSAAASCTTAKCADEAGEGWDGEASLRAPAGRREQSAPASPRRSRDWSAGESLRAAPRRDSAPHRSTMAHN